MAKFCKNFINDSQAATAVAPAPVDGIVMSLFDKYDTNNSGFLEKKEALRLLNDLLANKGQPPATYLELTSFSQLMTTTAMAFFQELKVPDS